MAKEFPQVHWDERLELECRQLVRMAVHEDLEDSHDWTTLALVPEAARGEAQMRTREDGVVAGLIAASVVLDEMDADVQCRPLAEDGQAVQAGQAIATLSGSARELLTSERILLNVIGRLSGVASLTRQYVQLVAGQSRVYDTRKTTPGWRALEKYAVRCGGGWNHRQGLSSAVLIKDNHLAYFGQDHPDPAAAAVAAARRFLALASREFPVTAELIIEIEVDTLEQLRAVLPERPDIVLLDNMSIDELTQAVRIRDQAHSSCELEASGGVTLQTIAAIAATGVERISVGSLTHSPRCLDISLDWGSRPAASGL